VGYKKNPLKVLIILLFISSFSLWGKSVEVSIDPSGSLIKVFGTSNVQSWQLKAKSFKGSGTFDLDKNELKTVEKFSIEVVAAKVLGKSRTINRKVAKALEVVKFPIILGEMKNVSIKGSTISGKMSFNLHGIKKELNFNAKVKKDGKNFLIEGVQKLDMTDFKIKPPETKVLFITAIVAPVVTVNYKLTLIRN